MAKSASCNGLSCDVVRRTRAVDTRERPHRSCPTVNRLVGDQEVRDRAPRGQRPRIARPALRSSSCARPAVLVLGALPIVSSAGCAIDQIGTADTLGDAEADHALPAIEPVVTTLSPREPLSSLVFGPGTPQQWSFAVLSDLHLPNPRVATVDRTIEG